MSESTAIEWADATFNPWWGCRKVSPACDHCYAETFAAWIAPGLWDTANRRVFGDDHWKKPLLWARKLPAVLGRRPRVFCASMGDVFDNEAPAEARARLFALIHATPELDWLLLTKRIGNAMAMVQAAADWHFDHGDRDVAGWLTDWYKHGIPPANVWLGSTLVTQKEIERDVDKLVETPAAVRFISFEPLLEHVFLRADLTGIHWGIVGGESGGKARPFHAQWARTLITQCRVLGIAPFIKQMGAVVYDCPSRVRDWPAYADVACESVNAEPARRIELVHRKGGDMAEWPEGLRVREFPR